MSKSTAEALREYGVFPSVENVHGVTYDGRNVGFAPETAERLRPRSSGKTLRSIDVAAHAGTAFDGTHLFQLAEDRRPAACSPRFPPRAAAVTRG